MKIRRAERARQREKLARSVRRLGSLKLILNPETKRMEPLEDQEKEALEVENLVKSRRYKSEVVFDFMEGEDKV